MSTDDHEKTPSEGSTAVEQPWSRRRFRARRLDAAEVEARFDERVRARGLDGPAALRLGATLLLLAGAGALAFTQSEQHAGTEASTASIRQEQAKTEVELSELQKQAETAPAPDTIGDEVQEAAAAAEQLAQAQTQMGATELQERKALEDLSEGVKTVVHTDARGEDFDPSRPWFLVQGPAPEGRGSYSWSVVGTDVSQDGTVGALWQATGQGSSDVLAWTTARWDPQTGTFTEFVRGVTPEGKEYERQALVDSMEVGPDQGDVEEAPSAEHLASSRAEASAALESMRAAESSQQAPVPAAPGSSSASATPSQVPSPSGSASSAAQDQSALPPGSSSPAQAPVSSRPIPSLPPAPSAVPGGADATGYGDDFVPPREGVVSGEED